MGGGLISLFAMYLAFEFVPKYISVIGFSLLGAFFHNTGQSVVLGPLLGSWEVALSYYPILVLAALATGSLTGYIASYFLKHIQSIPLGRDYPKGLIY
ncbi:MAG: Gx transporter family protein [Tissierellia bacterium]|nr:Gx transporter family protein [Tissierellia bacterium]